MYTQKFLQDLTFKAVSRNNWNKFTILFGAKGACGNCWCMYYRLSKIDFKEGKLNDGNKEAMYELVKQNKSTSIIASYQDVPIAWCAFAPREDFDKLKKSRVHKPIDNEKVWSIPCTFIHKDFRRKGVSVALLKGLIKYAAQNNIKIIEA